MRALPVLALLLLPAVAAAAPMPLAEAREKLAAGALDDLYLAFASVKPGRHPDGDAPVAAFLVEAARAALAKPDPTLALGFSDAARRLAPRSAAACLAGADAALALGQRGAAQEALEAAGAADPKNADILWRRAVFAEEEGETARASELFRAVPKGDPHAAQAAEHLAHLAAQQEMQKHDRAEQKRLEEESKRRQRDAGARAGSALPPELPPSAGARVAHGESPGDETPAGMIARRSDHFRIVYSQRGQDFAQKARYEERVLEMFERARVRVQGVLGSAPTETEVVLYTAEEFALHFGDRFGGATLGFYAGRIRMNYADDPGERFYATAVHEYVHAAVDDLAGGHDDDVPTWLNEGLARWIERASTGGDYIGVGERAELRAARRKGQLSLASLAHTPYASLGPMAGLAYALGSSAIQVLAGTGDGMRRLVSVLSEVGSGSSFESAFAARFGAGRLEGLDEETDRLIGK